MLGKMGMQNIEPTIAAMCEVTGGSTTFKLYFVQSVLINFVCTLLNFNAKVNTLKEQC